MKDLFEIFDTDKNKEQLAVVMHALQSAYGTHPLYEMECVKLICEDMLYDPEKHTLEYACKEGNFQVLKWLIDTGEYPDVGALKSACQYGQMEIVKYLLSIKTNDHPSILKSALWKAVDYGHLELVKYLVSLGATITESDIAMASRGGHLMS